MYIHTHKSTNTYIYIYIYKMYHMYMCAFFFLHFWPKRYRPRPMPCLHAPAMMLDRKGGTVGNPHRAQNSQFELFELIPSLELDKRFPVEQFEATVSQSTVPSPPLSRHLEGVIEGRQLKLAEGSLAEVLGAERRRAGRAGRAEI